MDMRQKNGSAVGLVASLFAFIITAVLCVNMDKGVSTTFGILKQYTKSYGNVLNIYRADSLSKAQEEATDESLCESQSKATGQALPQKAEEESTTQAQSSVLSDTPEDLLKQQEQYREAFASCQPDGEVTEVFFDTNGATDYVGKVYIRNTTQTKKPDFEALLTLGAELQVENKGQPTVLIFHTHTTESYLQVDDGVFYTAYQTRSKNAEANMVRVGDEICKVLESMEIGVIHDTEIYDEMYDGAYERSRKSVLKYLEQYPSIKIVLDVHRDAIYYSDTLRCKPTAVINGKKAAQIMMITGAEEGQITSFPYWESNLRFALTLQNKAQERFEGLMKPIYFCQRRYNMDTAKCSLLVEIGTDANTLEEACYSARLFGTVLGEIVNEYTKSD